MLYGQTGLTGLSGENRRYIIEYKPHPLTIIVGDINIGWVRLDYSDTRWCYRWYLRQCGCKSLCELVNIVIDDWNLKLHPTATSWYSYTLVGSCCVIPWSCGTGEVNSSMIGVSYLPTAVPSLVEYCNTMGTELCLFKITAIVPEPMFSANV